MNILLLGASGYVGTAIYHRLASRPSVRLYGTEYRAQTTKEHMLLDVTQMEQVKACLAAAQPAIVIWALMGQEERLIGRGLDNLLRVISPCTRLVYLSTDGVFGEGRGAYREEDATSETQSDSALAAYSNAKRKGEAMISERHPEHLIIRTGPVYGANPDGVDRRTDTLVAALATGQPYGRADNVYRTFVHVDDLAAAIAELCEKDITGILHVGPSTKESHYTFSRKRAAKLGYSPEQVIVENVSEPTARLIGLPLDTSLCTKKVQGLLRTTFRSL